ncbi:MAG: NUDIX hydrolase [Desulfurococcaceae archaeon]
MKPMIKERVSMFKGLRFDVERVTVEARGRTFQRDVVVFPQSSVILPLLDDRRALFLSQYRAPINDYIFEVPAGVVNPGETPLEAAKRELVEETGYEASSWQYLGSFYPVPGYSTELMHFFVARGLRHVGARPEPYELIEVQEVEMSDALGMLKGGEIKDMKTALAILLWTTLKGHA